MFSSHRALRVAAGTLSLVVAAALQPAVAQFVSDNGRGSAVFVPYYTINDGWDTLINVTNTSGNSLAVKVRLHEARNSRDVLDFIVLLSPFDVWTAWVTEGNNGRPFLQTNDRSCTVPLQVRDSGAHASELAYSGQFTDHTATDGDISRMSEGYIEILVMGETEGEGEAPGMDGDDGSTAWYAVHENGEPRDCQIIQNDFVRRTANWGGDPTDAVPGEAGSGSPLARLGAAGDGSTPVLRGGVASGDASPYGYDFIFTPDPLKVNTTLVNQATGRAAGIESLHVQFFGIEANLVAAQQFPWFLEPSLASSNGLWSTTGLTPIQLGIGATQVMNEWSNNPAQGAGSDWVVTFPTKRFQADEDAPNIQAACSVWRNAGSGGGAVSAAVGDTWAGWPGGGGAGPPPNELAQQICPPLGFPTVFQDGNDGMAELRVVYDIFDREEGTVTFELDGPVISPDPPPEVTIDNLRYEVNVLRIGKDAANLPSSLNSLIAGAVDTQTLPSGANNGWLVMTFEDGDGEPVPYATTGFIYKQRDFGNPGLNFGQATEHGYTRPQFVM